MHRFHDWKQAAHTSHMQLGCPNKYTQKSGVHEAGLARRGARADQKHRHRRQPQERARLWDE
jgi:hypothetical protein